MKWKADIWKNIDIYYRRRSIMNYENEKKKKIHIISARRKEDRDHKDDLSYLTIGYGSLVWSTEEVEDMLKKRAWQRRIGKKCHYWPSLSEKGNATQTTVERYVRTYGRENARYCIEGHELHNLYHQLIRIGIWVPGTFTHDNGTNSRTRQLTIIRKMDQTCDRFSVGTSSWRHEDSSSSSSQRLIVSTNTVPRVESRNAVQNVTQGPVWDGTRKEGCKMKVTTWDHLKDRCEGQYVMKTYTGVENWSDDDKDVDRELGCRTADRCSTSRESSCERSHVRMWNSMIWGRIWWNSWGHDHRKSTRKTTDQIDLYTRRSLWETSMTLILIWLLFKIR